MSHGQNSPNGVISGLRRILVKGVLGREYGVIVTMALISCGQRYGYQGLLTGWTWGSVSGL